MPEFLFDTATLSKRDSNTGTGVFQEILRNFYKNTYSEEHLQKILQTVSLFEQYHF